jgi:hypothetical protein
MTKKITGMTKKITGMIERGAGITRGRGNDRGDTDIGVEDINDLCPQCREELGVMDLPGFGE